MVLNNQRNFDIKQNYFDKRLVTTQPKAATRGVLKNFAKLTGKHMCHVSFLIKLQASNHWHRCFLVNFLRTPFCIEHLRWLLPYSPDSYIRRSNRMAMLRQNVYTFSIFHGITKWLRKILFQLFFQGVIHLVRTYQGVRNISFSENVAFILNERFSE